MRLTLHTRPLNFNFTCPKTKFACPRQSDLHFSFPVGHNVLTNFEVCDPFTNSRHYPTWFMPKNHRCCEDEVPDSSPLPVMYIWTTDSHSMHCNLYFFNLEVNGMKLIWKAWKIHQFFSRDVISGINTGTQSHQNNAIQKHGKPLLFQLCSKRIALRASAPPTLYCRLIKQ